MSEEKTPTVYFLDRGNMPLLPERSLREIPRQGDIVLVKGEVHTVLRVEWDFPDEDSAPEVTVVLVES